MTCEVFNSICFHSQNMNLISPFLFLLSSISLLWFTFLSPIFTLFLLLQCSFIKPIIFAIHSKLWNNYHYNNTQDNNNKGIINNKQSLDSYAGSKEMLLLTVLLRLLYPPFYLYSIFHILYR